LTKEEFMEETDLTKEKFLELSKQGIEI